MSTSNAGTQFLLIVKTFFQHCLKKDSYAEVLLKKSQNCEKESIAMIFPRKLIDAVKPSASKGPLLKDSSLTMSALQN